VHGDLKIVYKMMSLLRPLTFYLTIIIFLSIGKALLDKITSIASQ